MPNLTDPSILEDPVEIHHGDVFEEPDWRDRGSTSELTTPMWYGGDGDFGAMTRFGLGWGPLEVRRARRYGSPDTTRVLDLIVAGVPHLRIFVRGEGDQVRVLDTYVRDEDLDDPRHATTIATRYVEGDPRTIASHDVEIIPSIDGHEPEPPRAHDPDDAVLITFVERLKECSLTVQEHLTEERRSKRYLPRAAMDAIDQITTLITEFTGEERAR